MGPDDRSEFPSVKRSMRIETPMHGIAEKAVPQIQLLEAVAVKDKKPLIPPNGASLMDGGRKDHGDKVIVTPDLNHRLDRQDAQIAQPNMYHSEPFANVLNIKDGTKARLQDPSPQIRDAAARHNEEAWKEINARRDEARQAGLLAPIDRVVQPLDAQYAALQQAVANGNARIGDIQGFQNLLNNTNLNNVRWQDGQGRLEGVPEFQLETQLNRLKSRASQLVNQIAQGVQQPQNPNQGPQAPDQTQQAILAELRAQRQLLQRDVDIAERQYNMSIQGYDTFVDYQDRKFLVELQPFEALSRAWMSGKTKEQRSFIRTAVNINIIAAKKLEVAGDKLDDWAAIDAQVSREGMQNAWADQSGWRFAMATFMHDLYEQDRHGQIVLSRNGINKMKDQGGLRKWKDELTDNLISYYTSLPNNESARIEQQEGLSIDNVARAAVAGVDNFLYAMCAIDSGDTKREIKDTDVISDAPQTFLMPGVRAKEKWIGKQGPQPRGQVSQQDWGGIAGNWMRSRAFHSKEFRTELANGQIQYFPDRIMYGALDLLSFNRSNETLGQRLCPQDKDIVMTEIAPGVWDYVNPSRNTDYMNWNQLEAADLYAAWVTTRNKALAIYKHLTATDKKDMYLPMPENPAKPMTKYYDTLTQLRSDNVLGYIYENPDFIIMCLGLSAFPDGFIIDSNHIQGKVYNPTEYQIRIDKAASDERVFDGMPDFFDMNFIHQELGDTGVTVGAKMKDKLTAVQWRRDLKNMVNSTIRNWRLRHRS